MKDYKMDYKNPRASGENAFLAGLNFSDNPVDYRTNANARFLWDQGFIYASKNKCNGEGCKALRGHGHSDKCAAEHDATYNPSPDESTGKNLSVYPDSKEWVNGIPPVGEKFILENEYGNYDYEMLAHHGDRFWAIEIATNEYVSRYISSVKFHTIKTERAIVIEEAMRESGLENSDLEQDGFVILSKLYDLGMLSIPNDKEDE